MGGLPSSPSKKRIFKKKHLCIVQYFIKYLCYLSFKKFLTFLFNKNETESKMEIPIQSFREMNHVLPFVRELQIKRKTVMS